MMMLKMNRFRALLLAGGALLISANGTGCSILDNGFGGGSQPTAYTPPPAPVEEAPAHAHALEVTNPRPAGSLAGTLFENTDSVDAVMPLVNVFGEFGHDSAAAPRFGPGGFEQVTFLDEGYDSDVEVSPDGKWLVFASTRHNERPEIYLQRVGGLSVTQLTTDSADDAFPTFSPDGTRVAFCSTRNGSWDLYLMDLDGKNITQLTSSQMQELHPSFSPDGTRLVYCATGTRSGQWELWTIDLRSMEKRMIGYGLFPVWSPNTKKDQIAFQRARQRGSRWFSVWMCDLIDSEARSVTEVAVSGNAAVVSPSWSPDGSMLAFSTIVNPGLHNGSNSNAYPAANGGRQQDVWIINADGTGRRRLTDGNGVNATPTWSKDGRVFFVSDRGGVDAIWSARVSKPTAIMTAETKRANDPFASTSKDEVGH